MCIVFDGRAFGKQKEKQLKEKVTKLKQIGIYPKLASILIGNDPASELYIDLKKKAAERIGAKLGVYLIKEDVKNDKVIKLVERLNIDSSVHGIMIQLPLPSKLKKNKNEIISKIDSKKDVDGLKKKSIYIHPTAKAVLTIIKEAEKVLGKSHSSIVILGKGGMVGSSLISAINKSKYRLISDTKKADILVSATGLPGMVREDMVKKGSVVIDVGSPKADVDFNEVSKKASFVTPVPGGVGPVTITCLLENLIASAGKLR
ncbi:tetrahydrofolate dehydrogenase/cyclohydrolase catalytic domain-containing protein [Patescibacteria group bacterium]